MAPAEPALATATAATPPPPAPHFVIVPLVAPGHIIPLVDLARLLAARGARACACVVTTPLNAARLHGVADQAERNGLPLEFVELPFPPPGSGLPADCQNFDMIPSQKKKELRHDPRHFPVPRVRRRAARARRPVRGLRARAGARPSCIISDWCNPWTAIVATSLGIPRLSFHGPSFFFSLCDLMADEHGLTERIAAGDEQEEHVVPGLPVTVKKVTKDTPTGFFNEPGSEKLCQVAMEAMRTADGVVVNTFPGDEAVPVARGDVVRAVSALMGGGEEADERRRKAREYAEKARRAMEKGGSSYEDLTRLVESFKRSGVKEH